MEDLLRISEVARRFNISRPALIHYDQIDLLKPSFRNDKNYRFYSKKDLMKLELILALKESGLSIREIKGYMEGSTSSSSLELLINQQKEINKKIAELKNQKKILENRISMLERFLTIDLYEGVKLDSYPELVVVIEKIGYGPLMSYESAVARLKSRLSSKGHLASKFGICFDISGNKQSSSYKMKYIFDYMNVGDETDDVERIPQSDYIRCIHRGTFESINDTIANMVVFAEDHNLNIGDDAFFVPLFDYWEVLSEDEFINEILIPVHAKQNVSSY